MRTHPTIESLKAVGLKAKYECSTNGGEWHAACPFCREETGDGGKDRLILWPEKGNFLCRRGHKGEIAAVLARQGDLTLCEARQRLNPSGTQRPKFTPRRNIVRSPERWQKKVAEIIRTREVQLASDDCEAQREYLAARGLRPETIKAARLGGCHETRYYPREDFGLLPEEDEGTGKPRTVCVPEGILIPYFDAAGACVKLQSRCEETRAEAEEYVRQHQVGVFRGNLSMMRFRGGDTPSGYTDEDTDTSPAPKPDRPMNPLFEGILDSYVLVQSPVEPYASDPIARVGTYRLRATHCVVRKRDRFYFTHIRLEMACEELAPPFLAVYELKRQLTYRQLCAEFSKLRVILHSKKSIQDACKSVLGDITWLRCLPEDAPDLMCQNAELN